MKWTLLALLFVLAIPAHADSFATIDFTIAGSLTGNGTLTIDRSIPGEFIPGGIEIEVGNPIVDINGTLDGLAISLYSEGLWIAGISHFVPLVFETSDGSVWTWLEMPPDNFDGQAIFSKGLEYETADISNPNPANPIQVTFGPVTLVSECTTGLMLLIGLISLWGAVKTFREGRSE